MQKLTDLWNAESPDLTSAFRTPHDEILPVVQRYLDHAIAPRTAPATAVQITMDGEIRARGWMPFSATQVIRGGLGFIWSAKAGPIWGYDRLLDGHGQMKWRVLGAFPFMAANGPDTTKAAEGRLAVELVWIPTLLGAEHVRWTGVSDTEAIALFVVGGSEFALHLTFAENGAVKSAWTLRWGNPDGGEHRFIPFGAIVEDEATFDGFTIPTKLRAGWYFGTDRFAEGDFFHCTVTKAEFR